MVPTFTWGFDRSNFSFAIAIAPPGTAQRNLNWLRIRQGQEMCSRHKMRGSPVASAAKTKKHKFFVFWQRIYFFFFGLKKNLITTCLDLSGSIPSPFGHCLSFHDCMPSTYMYSQPKKWIVQSGEFFFIKSFYKT